MQRSQKSFSGTQQAFFYALVTGLIIFIPLIIYDKGLFIYYGDYNVQQIPFYKLAHAAVRSGDVFWSWYTDLGANFIGSYSFYLLFSPFFWLTLPFPTAVVPYLLAPLLVLKSACAALTSFLFLRRFIRDERFAVLASLLYAFSGWMQFNIFFNHFHEVAVFFPLLLLAVEKMVTEDKRGLLAVAVAVNAMVNYWFFVGEAIFVVIYVLVRRTDKSWGLTLKKFLLIALEAALGFAVAAAVVLPSVLALMGNPRTGSDELISGWNIWLYWHEQRQPAIIQSLFFPPEHPARPNFLPDHGAKWASLSAWLPLFSMTGVLAYFFRRRDDWVKKILALSLIFALIPLLNNMFILFNGSYYARWFYMPILLMALATGRALEDSGPEFGERATADFSRSVKWTAVVLVFFTVMCGLTPWRDDDGFWALGLADEPTTMWIFAAIAMICLAITAALVLRFRDHPRFPVIAIVAVIIVTASFSEFYLFNTKYKRDRSQWLIDHGINLWEEMDLPDDGEFSRVDVYNSTDNIAMYWHLPNIQAFHSIVPTSIMEFYPQVGVTRDVGSRPEADYYALRPLLSVRWLFIEESNGEQNPMPGYSYYGTQHGFNVYENEHYLPMGYSYNEYVTPRQMEDVAKENRSNLMLRALVIEEEAEERLSGLLRPMSGDGYLDFDPYTMAVDVMERGQMTADSFEIDRKGFTVTTSFEEARLLFLSVPYEAGWSATITVGTDSGPLRIEKVNLGFMGVQVPAGSVTVRFDYQTPGLILGVVITVGSILMLAGYLLITKNRQSPPAPQAVPDVNDSLVRGERVNMTAEQYRQVYGDRDARRGHVQSALQPPPYTPPPYQAPPPIPPPIPPRVTPGEELSREEQTLHFDPNGTQGPGTPPPPAPIGGRAPAFSFEDVAPPPIEDIINAVRQNHGNPTIKPAKPAPTEKERSLEMDYMEDLDLEDESLLLDDSSLLDEEPSPADSWEDPLADLDATALSEEKEAGGLSDDFLSEDLDSFGLDLEDNGNTIDTDTGWEDFD